MANANPNPLFDEDEAPAEKTYRFYYPPFPNVPEGKTVLSFNDYKERGICVADDSDAEELDMDGVQTLRLPVAHVVDPDEKAANDRRKRAKKRRKKDGAGMAPSNKKASEPEPIRPWYEEWEDNMYREKVTKMETMANRETRLEQIFVDFQTERKFNPCLQSIYDNFKLFIGVHENSAGATKKTKKGQDEVDDDSDGDAESEWSGLQGQSEYQFPPFYEQQPAEDEPQKPSKKNKFKEEKPDALSVEEKMIHFLEKPKDSLRLFFCSFAYERGLVWDPDKRKYTPMLIDYIIKYIIRHRTLKEYNPELIEALEIVEKAKHEQPSIGALAELIPDKFSIACREFWDRSDGLFWNFDGLIMETDTTETSPERAKEAIEEENSDAVKDDAAKVPVVDDPWGAFGEIKPNPEENVNSWASTTQPIDMDTWIADEPDWNIPPIEKELKDYYGTLHESHVKIQSENGLRKLIGVEGADPDSTSCFRRPMGVMIMAPWHEHKTTSMTFQPYPQVKKAPGISEAVAVPEHDPLNDTIRVYVDTGSVPELKSRIGMGIRGYWIQVAKKIDEDQSMEIQEKQPDTDSEQCWWYCEDTHQIMQSFWAE